MAKTCGQSARFMESMTRSIHLHRLPGGNPQVPIPHAAPIGHVERSSSRLYRIQSSTSHLDRILDLHPQTALSSHFVHARPPSVDASLADCGLHSSSVVCSRCADGRCCCDAVPPSKPASSPSAPGGGNLRLCGHLLWAENYQLFLPENLPFVTGNAITPMTFRVFLRFVGRFLDFAVRQIAISVRDANANRDRGPP